MCVSNIISLKEFAVFSGLLCHRYISVCILLHQVPNNEGVHIYSVHVYSDVDCDHFSLGHQSNRLDSYGCKYIAVAAYLSLHCH